MISVACVMLANGRIDMVRRAIESFKRQTYENKLLLIFDTGDKSCDCGLGESLSVALGPNGGAQILYPDAINHMIWPDGNGASVGALRNMANTSGARDVIIHWDSDDWSHPNRITEQVALLQSSGKQCVGYRNMLFWKTCPKCDEGRANTLPRCPYCGLKYDPLRETPVGEAWLYSNPDPRYCLGTSLCYWRSAWEQRPFPDLPKKRGDRGEDVEWLREIDSVGFSSTHVIPTETGNHNTDCIPRMIASIHGANTQYYGADLLEQSTSWRRAPEWDGYCAEADAPVTQEGSEVIESVLEDLRILRKKVLAEKRASGYPKDRVAYRAVECVIRETINLIEDVLC